MHFIFNQKSARKAARIIERALAKQGIDLKYGQALEVVAQLAGHADSNALAASFKAETIDKTLMPIELDHIENNRDTQYENEGMLVAHSGFQLRFDNGDSSGVSYVRVCDPLGRETAYWVSDEWQEDPDCVMGAILGALCHGQVLDPGARKGKASATAQPETATPEAFNASESHGTQYLYEVALYANRNGEQTFLRKEPIVAKNADEAGSLAIEQFWWGNSQCDEAEPETVVQRAADQDYASFLLKINGKFSVALPTFSTAWASARDSHETYVNAAVEIFDRRWTLLYTFEAQASKD